MEGSLGLTYDIVATVATAELFQLVEQELIRWKSSAEP
jgi:hypothetical protein